MTSEVRPPEASLLTSEAIVRNGLRTEAEDEPERYSRCRSALRLFLAIYASEAGNLALRSLAYGGVFLAGNLTRALLPLLQAEASFRRIFAAKPPLSSVLEGIPLHVICDPQPVLSGLVTCFFENRT